MAIPNLGEVAASTLQNYQKTLKDNIFKQNVLLDHMKQNGGVDYQDGGREIVVPLMYSTNTTVMAFSGTDTLDTTYQNTVDAAVYAWKYYNVSVVITKEDELKNNGKHAVVSLLKAKIKQAEMSLAERLNNDLFNGAASNSKEITGIDTAIGTGTYGGIAGATETWWNSPIDSTSEALSIADIRTMFNNVNRGNGGKCSIIVTTQTLLEKYESLLTATIQYQSATTKEMKRIGDAGFLALGFRGVPMVYDEQATSGVMYFLNPENLKLMIHSQADFAVEKKASPSDQHVSVQHIMFAGNTIVNRRASLGKLTNKTA